jgi:signal peptidase II
VRLSGFWTLAGFILVLDQWTNHLVERHLSTHSPSLALLPGVYLTHVKNPGTAFGLLGYGGNYLAVVAILAVVFIVAYWAYLRRRPRPPSIWLLCGLAMPLGGALGNLLDRLRLGYVTDFVDLRFWPVFNVADSAITIGACLVAYHFFFVQERGQREAASCVPEPPTLESREA